MASRARHSGFNGWPGVRRRCRRCLKKSRDVLNFALTLEYLEDEFYRKGLDAKNMIPDSSRSLFEQIGKHEAAHVELLKGTLGSSAVKKPEFDFTAGGKFGDVFSNYETFLALFAGIRGYRRARLQGSGRQPARKRQDSNDRASDTFR